ncbi:sensor histidine kinase [Pseudoxanthomonas sp. 10H]|uniref:sensor histidine kinase n=1 Tax=Pseudoxanthomonas sp. 10H TaxID=3242729 RepID=UPI003556C494
MTLQPMALPASSTRASRRPPRGGLPAIVHASFLLLGLLLAPAGARALDPARHIAQFHHTAWTVKEGAPGGITALAQTGDGYLWLATQVGLFRFDGVAFERFEPGAGQAFPAESISTLHASPAGLWIGYRYGSISLLRDGGLVHYGQAQGLPTSSVYRIAEDRDGTLWAATFGGLFFLRDGRWHPLAPAAGLPAGVARTVFVDAAGTLWVASDTDVHFRRRGQAAFETAVAGAGRVVQFAQAPGGALWVATLEGGVRPLRPVVGATPPVLGRSSAGLVFDRDGSLWASTLGEGLLRLARPDAARMAGAADRIERFQQPMGLSSDNLLPVIEDREGNIWVGGSRGLDRFRQSHLVPAMLPAGAQDFALAALDGGRVLAGSRNQPPMVLSVLGAPGGAPLPGLDAVGPPITAAHRGGDGVAWLGGPGGLWRLQHGVASRVAPLPVDRYSGVQAIATDAAGALWVSINTPGVYQLLDGRWRHWGPADLPDFPGEASPLVLLPASDGTLWMGFARNQILLLRQGTARAIGDAQGLQVGNVTALHEAGGAVWIGGERGIARFAGGRLQNRAARDGSALRGISGIVRAPDGSLWLNGARGVVHVAAGDVGRLFEPAAGEPPHVLYDHLDGLPGVAAQLRPIPTAVRAGDGRLWFATTNGVVSMAPGAIRRNPLPPPVHVLALQVDGRTYRPADAPVALPPGSANLQLAYTATSLSIPERVRFRYRLEGHDDGWREAGTRRVAFYTDVGPGDYVFRVVAANEDGVWNEAGDALAFSVQPRFHQTWWFLLLCLLVGVGGLWLAYLMRLRQLGRHIRGRLQERHAERERIARELHDTLLQGIQGLVLRFQAVSETLPPLDPARSAMEQALQRADDVLVEGRDRVLDLRATAPDAGALEDLLSAVGEELAPLTEARFEVSSSGNPEVLDPIVRDELYRIGREAMVNACRHARAGRIGVEVDYGAREMRLRVVDDGRGIDAQTLERGGRAGHWGMHGMRERAGRIGARLRVWSRPGAGTEVDLRIAAGSAYRPCLRASRWAWLRAIFRRRPD